MSLHGKQYGKPNYSGPMEHEQGMEEVDAQKLFARALMKRKQSPKGA